MRNLVAGKYQFDPQFHARYWYVQSITMIGGAAAKPQKIDAAANWTTVKSGEQLANLTITLAAGAASIRGRVPVLEGAATAATSVFLLPAEPDKADDVLRYFVSEVGDGRNVHIQQLAPGKYLTLVDTQATTLTKLRHPKAPPRARSFAALLRQKRTTSN
jgi:hypothetical protein